MSDSFDVPAATAELDSLATVQNENGYDMVDLRPGSKMRVPLAPGRYGLEIRLNGGPGALERGEGVLRLGAEGGGETRQLGDVVVPALGIGWFTRTAKAASAILSGAPLPRRFPGDRPALLIGSGASPAPVARA